MSVVDVEGVCYPRRFEIFRLEPLGDEPYFETDEARQRYVDGRGLSIVSGGTPPSWLMQVSAKRYRFSITFYSESKSPLRKVTWEQVGTELFCRKTIDMFYPDGDPGRGVPSIDLVTVTQQISTDGVLSVTLSSPIDEDDFREVTGVPLWPSNSSACVRRVAAASRGFGARGFDPLRDRVAR
jgi:hypothetical protein